ncbi:MAG: crossover junction endodeoxyribonuclease RuvC [Candidatus Omnitrophica bacterium]|nr:crossover junction endodeoxyribonuclease RuvC [Candidatus Omnitrophota bacterium]MBI3083867.1 crossover junction endodeoxyribonuclease RuvC [Candidatus Omnitrophota bacterium]
MIILGIDPGLNVTGYGIMEALPDHLRLITAGDIRPPRTEPMAQRLGVIHRTLSQLIVRYHPDTVVLEKIFTHYRHVTTATLMAHARGVACLVTQEHGLPLAEYPPTQVKKSLTGNGSASKEQVARMVGQWLSRAPACRNGTVWKRGGGGRERAWSADATDAMALAIVHAHIEAQRRNLPAGLH